MASSRLRTVLAGLKKASESLTQSGERQGVNPPRSITASHSHQAPVCMSSTCEIYGADAKSRDALLAGLQSLGCDIDAEYYQITLSGHGAPGNFGNGLITLDDLNDPKSRGYKIAKSLPPLLAEDAVIEFRACSVAQREERGNLFINRLAEITGARVIAYTDTYAFVPHGEEWTAYPDGRLEKAGDHGLYKGTIKHKAGRAGK